MVQHLLAVGVDDRVPHGSETQQTTELGRREVPLELKLRQEEVPTRRQRLLAAFIPLALRRVRRSQQPFRRLVEEIPGQLRRSPFHDLEGRLVLFLFLALAFLPS